MEKFNKVSRLCEKTQITLLFKSGEVIKETPFIIIFLLKEKSEYPIKLLISIPKKQIPKAVERNKLKRLIREAYRTSNSDILKFLKGKRKKIHIAFIYQEKEIKSFLFLQDKIRLILHRLKKQI